MPNQEDNFSKYQIERKRIDIREQQQLERWMKSEDPDLLIKAQLHLDDVQKRQSSGIKTLIFDPEERNQGDGFLRKSSALTFHTLRLMSKTPIISAIIKTRVEQVSEFTTPQTDRFQPGFVIRPKVKTYFGELKKAEPDEKLQARIDEMVTFMLNCGDKTNSWHGDTFDSFTRKLIPDSLAMDQATFEVVRNRRGQPIEIMAVDAATMRIADSYEDDEYEDQNQSRVKINGYYPSYVQVMDGQVRNEYYPWELCFGIRNHSTSVFNNAYGSSELEELMNIVTWMLNSDTYNGKFFSQGSAPKGIIKVSGNVNTARLNEFRQTWQATTATVMNAHKIPVIESDNFEFIDTQQKNRDMEFSQWQEYLIKIACAMYKIDPSEVFDLQYTNTNSFGGGNKEENVQYSKDKGLKPLLKAYAGWINKYIVSPKDPDLELVFLGVDAESEAKELDLDIKRASAFMGMNEVRNKHELGDLAEDDMILNPAFIQWRQMQMMGNPESNEAVSEFTEDYSEPGMEKSEDENPFIGELNSFVERVLMK